MFTANKLKKNAQMVEAERLFNRIPTGRRQPLKGASNNREFRRLVERANNSGKEIIINVGNGYYRPDVFDEGDLAELEEYLSRENGRAKEVLGKTEIMRRTLNEIQKEIIG